jgi:hypothetical protein
VIYQSGITDNYIITVQCKFSIVDFSTGQDILYVSTPVTSGTFNAYGSHSATGDDYHFYVTEAETAITISQLQVPPVAEVEMVSEDYMERAAAIYDKVGFDLMFDPATDETIGIIELEVPDGFGYPPVASHDACSMVSWGTQPIQSCL